MQTSIKAIFLKPNKEQALINRHPWIFSGAVSKTDHDIKSGEIITIKNYQGIPLALGHWCKKDGLVCRIFSFTPDTAVNDEFWIKRFLAAKALRNCLGLPNGHTNGYRLINGEGDQMPGLVCDIFADSAAIQSSNPGFSSIIGLLKDFLVHELKIKNIFYTDVATKESTILLGACEAQHFLENDLQFMVDMQHGQKTGHFLDQRDSRRLVQDYAKGRDVLDAFCYSGGFSVYALKGGAQSVSSVDIAAPALALCQKNVAVNGLGSHHHPIVADCFDYLRTIKPDHFDLIILDPPAFAKSAQAVMRAARGYKDINWLALKAVREGGLVFTFSCSQHVDAELFRKVVFAAAKDSKREVKVLAELSQGMDHPSSIYCPQSSYLKGLLLYVE